MKIGIMGGGHYGQLLRKLIRRFTDNVDVVMYDKHRGVDVHFGTIGALRNCAAVIFAVPMEQLESAMNDLLSLERLRKDMVFVNVCSDQTKSGETMTRLAGTHPYVCLHSPWGPEAYRAVEEVVSRLPPIVITKSTLADDVTEQLLQVVERCGFSFAVQMSAEEHDKNLAGRWMYTAHLVSQIMSEMGLIREDCSAAPISFQKIIEGARMLSNDRNLFMDLWSRVPECHRTFDAFLAATRKLADEQHVRANGK